MTIEEDRAAYIRTWRAAIADAERHLARLDASETAAMGPDSSPPGDREDQRKFLKKQIAELEAKIATLEHPDA